MPKKTLVLGLGNPILSDDGVGIRVVERMRGKIGDAREDIVFETGCFGGLHIVDAIRGFHRAIIIDAISRGSEPGSLYKLDIDDLDGTTRLKSPHRMNLPAAIELARKMENDIPEDITLYAVEAKNLTQFSTELSPEVEEKLDEIIDKIVENEF